MDTLKIKALLSAVKYKSLSKAAEDFSYTPSALSHSVDALENELNVKLLVRTHTGVRLTEEGEALLDKLNAVVKAESELFKKAKEISEKKQNHLKVGTYSSISVNLLPQILGEFKKKYPEITISITVGDSLKKFLESDKVDIFLGDGNPDYEWIPLIKDDFVAVVPEAMFVEKDNVSFEELYKYPFIISENLTVLHSFDLSGFKEIITMSSEDDAPAVSMVRQSMGVTILPSLVLNGEQKGVRVLKLKPEISRELGISFKKKGSLSQSALKFINFLKSMY